MTPLMPSMKLGSPPRARGRPRPVSQATMAAWAHPRVRGDVLLCSLRDSVRPGLTPACAGTSDTHTVRAPNTWAHPRVRGDVRLASDSTVRNSGSPPRARGRRAFSDTKPIALGLTPACAGTSIFADRLLTPNRAHPRVRGDVLQKAKVPSAGRGSPPRARGRRWPGASDRLDGGLTPACAGTSRRLRRACRRTGAHPRVRGDVDVRLLLAVGGHGLTPACAGTSDTTAGAQTEVEGSPPRARGRRPSTHRLRQRRGLTPACAGTSRAVGSGFSQPWAHPRVRGDVWVDEAAGIVIEGSPPRARGRPSI